MRRLARKIEPRVASIYAVLRQAYWVLSLGLKRLFFGFCNSNATAGQRPSGWTLARNGEGDYTITHNLGLGGDETDQFVVLQAQNTDPDRHAVVTSVAANTFHVHTFNLSSGALADSGFYFYFGIPS